MYVVNHTAFFVSHRLPLALGAMACGHQVMLATGQAGSLSMETLAERELREKGIAHVRVAFTPSGMNPFTELRGLLQLIRLMRKERPDLVHCASPKGILYGGIAARVAGVRALVIAVSGMGFAFSSSGQQSLLRSISGLAFRSLARLAYGHPNKKVIVQNSEDEQQILGARLATPAQLVLIPGSGVDTRRLGSSSIEAKTNMVLFAARMIFEKGVMEFIDAARIVRRAHPDWRFVMAGAADYANPSNVSPAQIEAYVAEGVIEWPGLVDDMDSLYFAASIVCLPSYYREGLPKVLLEAAAAGCAVVTTDLPGCREAIIAAKSGDLVPARDARAVAAALQALIEDRARREAYGRAGRELASKRFSIESVVEQVVGIYEKLLANRD